MVHKMQKNIPSTSSRRPVVRTEVKAKKIEIEDRYRTEIPAKPEKKQKTNKISNTKSPLSRTSEEIAYNMSNTGNNFIFSSSPPSLPKSRIPSPNKKPKIKKTAHSATNKIRKVIHDKEKSSQKRTILSMGTQKTQISKKFQDPKAEPFTLINEKELLKIRKEKKNVEIPRKAITKDTLASIEEKMQMAREEMKLALLNKYGNNVFESDTSVKIHFQAKNAKPDPSDNNVYNMKPPRLVGKEFKKMKKKEMLKSDKVEELLPPLSNTALSKSSSEELEGNMHEIKHNDSFYISAKKLSNSNKSRTSKPEAIKLFKTVDVLKPRSKPKDSRGKGKLKSCLKKPQEPDNKMLLKPEVKLKPTKTSRQTTNKK